MEFLQKEAFMLCDTHLHSSFSSDSLTDPNLIIEKAIELEMPAICFTDHCDLDYPGNPDLFQLDFPNYFSTLMELKEIYASKINVLIGVEMGLQPHLEKQINSLLQSYSFDYVIGSTHTVNGKDPAFPSFYEQGSVHERLHEYFTTILSNLNACKNFDSCGHLDYAVRYCPQKDAQFQLDYHQETIDEILYFLIKHQKSLEVNTGGYRCGLNRSNPGKSILKRYFALGGSQLTIGSDAHTIPYLGAEFARTKEQLKEIGFRYYCIYEQRKAKYLPL